MNKHRKKYVSPAIRRLEIDHQTSMILQSPPLDPPDVDTGFLKLPF